MNKTKFTKLTSLLLLSITTIPLCSCGLFNVEESVKVYKKSYTANEIRIAESNTFRKLNDVNYPDYNKPYQSTNLTEEVKAAYSNFSNTTYHAIVDTSDKENLSYCPVGLYSLMNEMYAAISRDDLRTRFDNLLGLNRNDRILFYTGIMNANSFVQEDSTVQLKNGAFFNNEFNFNQDYVDYLRWLYCEAYQLNFKNEADKIVDWVNQAVNEANFIDKNFLEMTKDTQLYLFSTLYFKNAWLNKYLETDSVKDDFHFNDGTIDQVNYMRHSYMSDCYYDYGKYISVKDYYYNRNASVTYLIPKDLNDNIFELTKNINIFDEIEENKVVSESEYGMNHFTVHLKTPRFKTSLEIDFKTSLTSLGFGDIFEPTIDSFKNAFNDSRLTEVDTIYIEKMKQKNEVEFNEDGTTVKSVSMASMSKGEASPGFFDSIDVNLNQPFIYIIRDVNDTPIFVGHVNDPR